MRTILSRFSTAAVLGAALLMPATSSVLQAQDHRYHDAAHNDDHEWNSHEDRAYRMWAKENHRRYRDFSKLKENDQQAYWAWRHEHDDAKLKIDIR